MTETTAISTEISFDYTAPEPWISIAVVDDNGEEMAVMVIAMETGAYEYDDMTDCTGHSSAVSVTMGTDSWGDEVVTGIEGMDPEDYAAHVLDCFRKDHGIQ